MKIQGLKKIVGLVAWCVTILILNLSTVMAQKVIGLQLYSVRDSMNVNPERTIKAVAKMGYKYVEAAGYWEGKFYGMEPEKFKSLLSANGLYLLSSHTGEPLPDQNGWEKTMAWWDQCIAAHVAAGAKYIIIPSMGEDGFENLNNTKRYCEYFNLIGEKCRAKGIRFGYHNHEKEFKEIDGTTVYDCLLRNTDPTKVFFEMDLWFIHLSGKNAIDYFSKYPGRFLFYHVKDEHEIGSSGKIDFKPLFDHVKKAGAKYFVAEIEHPSKGNSLESAKISLDFLLKAKNVK